MAAEQAEVARTALLWTEGLRGVSPQLDAIRAQWEALVRTAESSAIEAEIGVYQRAFGTLGQTLAELREARDRSIVSGANQESLRVLEDEIARIEARMFSFIVSLQSVSAALGEQHPLYQQIVAEVRNLTYELDTANDQGAFEAQQQRIQGLIQLQEELRLARAANLGDESLDQQYAEVNEELRRAIDNAIEVAEAMATWSPEVQAAILELKRLRGEIGGVGESALITGQDIDRALAQTGSNAIGQFAEDIADGRNALDSLRGAFKQFAADFLRRIADMILQQAIFNALQSAGIGGGASGIIGAIIGHSGIRSVPYGADGLRFVDASLFRNAVRLHSGSPGCGRASSPPSWKKVRRS